MPSAGPVAGSRVTEGGHSLTNVTPPVSRTRISIPGRALLTVLTAVCWLALPAALTARADDPVTLSRDGQITDKVGALGDRRDQVRSALDRLYADRRVQLFVVYVRDFSGRSAQSWADATADRNGLGRDDVLLAVATHDRQYAYTVEQGSRLTDSQLQDVASTAIEPALRSTTGPARRSARRMGTPPYWRAGPCPPRPSRPVPPIPAAAPAGPAPGT